MGIASLNSFSNFYQQPLTLSREEEQERIVSQETIYHWDVNEYVVYLIKEHDSLKYKTIDGNKKEIYCNDIDLPEEGDLEQEISYLKTCKVKVEENGAVKFYNTYYTWENADEKQSLEISLIRGLKGLGWNVFQNITKESSFYYFREVTIPSLRCHPETVALIDKIKKKAFNNPQYILCLVRDFKVRVINSEFLQKELAIEKKNLASESSSDKLVKESFLGRNQHVISSVTFCAVYFVQKVVVTTIKSVSRSCGGGILGSMVGVPVGVLTGATIAGIGGGVAVRGVEIVSSCFFPYSRPDFLYKKQKALEERDSLIPVEKPLFIEIEPISEPSVFDPRVRVSKFTWAVTVITTEDFCKSHAAIVIEGINDGFFNREAYLSIGAEIEIGEKFIYLAEFNPPVEAYLLFPSQLKYEKRTEIWMKTSDKVQEIIRDIGKEVLKENPRWFNIRGKNAFLPNITYTKKKWLAFFELPGDNCYTFTKDHTKKLDIDPGSSPADFIAAIARIYTKHPESYKSLPAPLTI
ncbi:MAG: hypothetical protein ACRDAI_06625 [Candidatus Rhabdochlamydia sp.]